MSKSQREKGKRGERELAKILREMGFNTRRGQQYCGAAGDADVIGIDGLHIECKRQERMQLWAWMKQAEAERYLADVPVVMHRANDQPWLVTVPLYMLPQFCLSVMDALPIEQEAV